MPPDHRAALKEIRTFPSLVRYLRDEMGWPIDRDDFEELTLIETRDDSGGGLDAGRIAKLIDEVVLG